MGNPINVVLYGADEDYILSEKPAVQELLAAGLSGLAYTDPPLKAYELDAGLELDSDELNFLDSRVYADKSFFGIYRLKLLYREYPEEPVSFDTQFPELAVLKKPYTWLCPDNYNIGFETEATVQAVNVMSWSETRFHNFKMIEITLKHRKPE